MSPLTPDERARAAEMLRFPERYDDASARALADKLEAEPEPTWRQQDGGEVGDEPMRFTIQWHAATHSYRVSVPNLMGPVQVVPAVAYDGAERERDEAREALRDLLLTIAEMSQHPLSDARGAAAVERGRAVLEGVERTHTLVPVEAVEGTAQILVDQIVDELRQEVEEEWAYVAALRAAARGERVVDWPGAS